MGQIFDENSAGIQDKAMNLPWKTGKLVTETIEMEFLNWKKKS